jgi:hypothetical protein
MSDDERVLFRWEGRQFDPGGVLILWPATERQMRLSLPDFRTAVTLGRTIEAVTEEAFVRGRESIKAEVLKL